MFDCRDFRNVEITCDKIVQYPQFLFIQIVFRYADIIQHRQIPGKGSQSHEWFFRIRPFVNDFCDSMAVRRIMEFILDNLEKTHRFRTVRIIIQTCRIKIQDLANSMKNIQAARLLSNDEVNVYDVPISNQKNEGRGRRSNPVNMGVAQQGQPPKWFFFVKIPLDSMILMGR